LSTWLNREKRSIDSRYLLAYIKEKDKEMSGIDWIVNEDGQAFHPEDEPVSSGYCFEPQEDFWANQRINRLLESGMSPEGAESVRRQIKNMSFLEKESFLSAVEQGIRNKPIHDRNGFHHKGSWGGMWNL
jgi:hypothetical protein